VSVHEHASLSPGEPRLPETQPFNSQGVRWQQKETPTSRELMASHPHPKARFSGGNAEGLSSVIRGLPRHGAGRCIWKQTPQLSTALDEPQSGLGTLTWLIQEVFFLQLYYHKVRNFRNSLTAERTF